MEVGGPSSERRRRRRGRRAGEDDGGGADRISDLPDAVLGDIISLLPTKEGARTRILASRWHHLWRSAPLNLDLRDLVELEGELAGVVSRILSSHQGPGRCFRIPGRCKCSGATVDSWLLSPAVDNLQELCLSYPIDSQSPLPLLSESFLRFSATLRVATIGNCRLLDSAVQGLQLPQLQRLTLELVSVSECSLQQMVAECPALECLLMNHCSGFRRFRINSGSIRSIGVRSEYYRKDELKFEELIIDNAPCLEKLLHLDLRSDLHVSVISAPKLDTLRCHWDTSTKISFGSMVIQGLRIDSLTTVVHSIKILSVDMDILSLDTIIDLMRCFPCLEKLYIQSYNSGPNNWWISKHKKLIRCHDFRLKKIVFKTYYGTRSQVNFLTFFVLNVRALESMTIRIEAEDYNKEFLAKHRKKLQLENSASRGARFQFTTDKCVRNIWDIKDVHDLDLADPFAC